MSPLFNTVRIFDEVAIVRRAVELAGVEVPSVIVPIFRLPLPVAFTKVRPVMVALAA